MEWLEVRIVVSSEWLVEQGRIRTLDYDRQPLENKQSFSAVTRHFTNLVAKVFGEMVCRVVHWAQGLHGNWKESVCWRYVRVFLAFPGSSEFGHLSTFTSCGSDIGVCQGAHNCDVPYQQLLEFVSSHPDVYHLDVLGRLVPSLQARSPTPGLEPSDRSVAILLGACLRLRAYRERQQPIPAVRSWGRQKLALWTASSFDSSTTCLTIIIFLDPRV